MVIPARLAAQSAAENACVSSRAPRAMLDYSISLQPAPGTPIAMLDEGLAYWGACAAGEDGVPGFRVGPGGKRTLSVEWSAGSSRARHCGRIEGNRIRLFAAAIGPRGGVVLCDRPGLTLAHELGHALGLDDAPFRPECRRHVMAAASGIDRAVQAEECRAVAARWRSGEALFLASQAPSIPIDWNAPTAP
jgi:hypothetical protein